MPVVGYCRNLYNNLCPCFVCSKKFSLDNGVEDLLTHICFTHRIIIESIDQIADFKKYMEYYMKRFKETSLDSFTKQITIEVSERESEPKEHKYYVLGNFLSEDENLRKTLHSKRLKAAQKQQKRDLSDKLFLKHCFYCHQTIRVTNAQLINHLRCHGFQLGHPEKLVYVEKFVEAIEGTFRTLHCLFCNMKFDTCRTLITHMEEKNHMKIHPNDRFYDQFYMINYVEFGKTWIDFLKEKNRVESDQDDGVTDDKDWSSWGTEPESIMCLFCKHICRSWDGTLLHMLVSHDFDFKAKISAFSFYQQVKLVNYIRRRILNNQCITCDELCDNEVNLTTHMEQNIHLGIPEKEYWNHTDYFFCTMENDMFLYHLEDQDDNDESDNLSDIKESSNIFRHYDIDNSESESGRSNFNQRISYDNNHDSSSTTDSTLEEDFVNSIGSEEDDHMKEFEEKIKVAFENSRKIEVPIKESDKEHYRLKNQATIKQTSNAVYHAAGETCVSCQEITPVNREGSGDSARCCLLNEESLINRPIRELGDAVVKTTNEDCITDYFIS